MNKYYVIGLDNSMYGYFTISNTLNLEEAINLSKIVNEDKIKIIPLENMNIYHEKREEFYNNYLKKCKKLLLSLEDVPLSNDVKGGLDE